ncbi:MAG: MATE family efflux transporter [Treponema sp.]|nr:MATE family efflux transporter [Treponema sp.]
MKDSTVNMTEGNTLSLLIRFSIPMLIGNIFQQLYNVVDSVVVGRLVGSDALGAVGATSSISFLFFALCNGIGNGGGIVTSQFFGKNDSRDIKSCIANVGYIMIIFPLIVGTAAFFLTGPLLRILNTPENLFHDAFVYMRILCVGLVFVSLYNYISSMLRALGDSKTPLYFLIFSCILNTGLDIFFVKVLRLSVFGAGIATLISQFISGAACLIYAVKTNEYFKLKRNDLKINSEIIRRSVKIGVPLSLQFSLIAVSTMALQRVVNVFGTVAVSTFTATSRVEQVIHQPYQTLSAALSTFIGQNFGAKKNNRVLEGYRKGFFLMLGFTILMFLVMQFLGKPIISIFIKDDEVMNMGAKALKITSFFYFFLGMIYLVRGVLNGVGDSFFALYNGIIEVAGRFTVPYILTILPLFEVWGIWWSVGIVWLVSGATAWFRFLGFKKKLKKDLQIL